MFKTKPVDIHRINEPLEGNNFICTDKAKPPSCERWETRVRLWFLDIMRRWNRTSQIARVFFANSRSSEVLQFAAKASVWTCVAFMRTSSIFGPGRGITGGFHSSGGCWSQRFVDDQPIRDHLHPANSETESNVFKSTCSFTFRS